MSITDQIQSIALQEYKLLRTCAKAVDQRLEPAVSNSPGLSTALDRVREVLRDFDDRVTGNDRFGSYPDADEQVDEPAASTPAARQPKPTPAPAAEQQRESTPDIEAEPENEPEAEAEAEAEEVEHLAEEFLEDEGEHHTGELAENEDLRDVQARLRAKHAVQEQHEQHDQQT